MTIVDIIHQGPQNTITFHTQNEEVGINGEKFSMLFLWSLTQKWSKTLIFEKRSNGHPSVCTLDYRTRLEVSFRFDIHTCVFGTI